MGRFHFLPGGFLVYAIGLAISSRAGFVPEAVPASLALAGVLSAQLMTHFVNEYFDYEGDMLSDRTAFSGGSGVLASGIVPRRRALQLGASCLVFGLASALALASMGRTWFLLAYAPLLFIGWFYSSPPLRFVSTGLGETFASLAVAYLAPVSAALSQAFLPLQKSIVLLPLSVCMHAMMLGVEAPDRPSDELSGKRNLVVRLGMRRTARAYLLIFFTSLAAQLSLVLAGSLGPPSLAAFALSPAAIAVSKWMGEGEPLRGKVASMVAFVSVSIFFGFALSTLAGA